MRKFRCLAIATALLLAAPSPATAQAPDPYSRQPTATGHGGAAATEHPLATQAAIDVLNAGGNAVDAAVAASAVQSVVRPFSGGIGGGGYMQVYDKETGKFTVLDHRSTAASSFDDQSFIDPATGVLYDEDTVTNSGVGVGMPGVVKAWEQAVHAYGSGMSLNAILQPAIQVATKGFYSDANLVREITENAARFCVFPETTRLYLNPDCTVPPAGTLIRNPDLAATYDLIAKSGSDAFYKGAVADAIVDTINHPKTVANPPFKILPGSATTADLSGYTVKEYGAATVDYRGYQVHVAPPSTSGVTVAQALNILEGYDLTGVPREQALHYYLEASRRAFADQQAYLGDPATYPNPLPIAGLLSERYAEQVRQRITETSPEGAVPPEDPWPFDADPNRQVTPQPATGKGVFAADFSGGTWAGFATEGAVEVRDNAGVMTVGPAASSFARAASGMQPVADSELLTRFRINDLGGDRRLRFWLRADTWNNSSSPVNGYAVEVNAAADTVRLIRTRDGNAVHQLASLPFTRSTGWQWLRFSVEGGALKFRIWADGQSEPRQSWTGQLQDTSVTGKGKLLISAIKLTGGAAGGAFSVDDLKVTDLHPVAFNADFTGLPDGASWSGFTTQFGNGASKPGVGAAIDVQSETGRLYLDKPQFSYARAEARAPQLTDSELLVKFRVTDPGGDRRLRFWLRGDAWNTLVTPSHGYGIEIKSTTDTSVDNIRLLRVRQGNAAFALAGVKRTMPAGWQWLRFRVTGEGLKARVWTDGEQEPQDWQLQKADAEIPGPGKLLISATESTGAAAGGAFHIDDLTLFDHAAVTGKTSPGDEKKSTIHLTVADKDGNIVSYTHTLSAIGGNGMVVPGRGFLLNNEVSGRTPDDAPVGHPNGPRGGMRPLSTQSPTIITKDGKPVMALGSPGGGTIVSTVLQVIVNSLDFGMTLPQAVAAPRLSQRNHSPLGNTMVEPEFTTTPEYTALKTKHGHHFDVSALTYGIGAVNAIAFLPTGEIQAVSEPVRRGGGSAMVQHP
ncbi:gamma-glutamyltransferase [Nonomuraea africana]|uniref:gamma-glutamyltransferase n=1 Tax=Nonomuraea africana TaxID=46171 RepID=UPI0033D130B4